MKLDFPAIFSHDKEDETFINVWFPDVQGAMTCGTTLSETREFAKDCLLCAYNGNGAIRKPSTLEEAKKFCKQGEWVELISIETKEK